MKKIMLWMIGILMMTFAVSCDDCDDCYSPNSNVEEVFYDYYPDAVNVEWYYVNGYSVADFDYYGQDMEAWFSNAGEWIYTKIEMEYTNLPIVVQESFMSSYYEYNIDDVEEIETSKYGSFYNIEVENDIEELSLLYDETGILLKVYANTLPYTWWEYFD